MPLGRVKGATTYNMCQLPTETKPSQPPPGRKDVTVAATRQSAARCCAKGATRLFSLGPARAVTGGHRHAHSRMHGQRLAEVKSLAQDHTAGRLQTRLRTRAVYLLNLRTQPLCLLVGSRPLLAPHPVTVLRTVARQPPSPPAASLPGTLGPPRADNTVLQSSWSATQATTENEQQEHMGHHRECVK